MDTGEARIADFQSALLALDRSRAKKIFLAGAESDGAIPIMEELVATVLDRIGLEWEAGRVALSQVYMAGGICEELALNLLPQAHPDRRTEPAIALAVFEDWHMLGKRMVQAVLVSEGFALSDWGRVDLSSLITRLHSEKVDILLLSCLMLHSALRIKKLRERMKAEGLDVKLVVGGAPFRFDPTLWQEVGADATGSKASEAGAIIRRLSGGAK